MTDLWDLSAVVAKFWLYLGVLIPTGAVFARLAFGAKIHRRRVAGFALLGLLAAVVSFCLGGAALTGDISGMIDGDMLALLWGTPVGTALALRGVGLALLMAGLVIGRAGVWLSAFGGCLALWSFVTVGHIPSRDLLWLNALLALHLATLALWIGILGPLRRLAADAALQDAADLGHRFGQAAAVFVPALVLAGAVMGFVLVGSFAALFGTSYGQTLLVKIASVAVLLGLAALNKLRFVPRLRAQEAQAARGLTRAITGEWVALSVILAATAVLTSVLVVPS